MAVAIPVESKLSKLAVYSTALEANWSVSEAPSGNKLVEGMRVFRAGTFRDSMGIQRTWDVEHLFQMVQNFKALRNKDVFPNVPVRTDHSFSVKDVMGWISDLAVDGEFLVASWEVTEPTSFDKVQRGTYRSRSLEVGMYETNDEQFYWPVVLGFAFVDIPAVEGLHQGAQPVACFSAVDTKETPVTTPTTPPADAGARPPEPAAPAPAPAPAMTFRVNGADTSDVGAVQRHIDALERFAGETREAGRRSYVAQLAADKKVTQPQVEGLTGLVLTMSDEQYTAFKATYDNAPALSLLGDHGQGVTNANGDKGTTVDPRLDRIAVLEETMAMFRNSGLSEDEIARGSSYKELVALRAGQVTV